MRPHVAASSVSQIANLSEVVRVDKRFISLINSARTKSPFRSAVIQQPLGLTISNFDESIVKNNGEWILQELA
jgi:hypothetical protein